MNSEAPLPEMPQEQSSIQDRPPSLESAPADTNSQPDRPLHPCISGKRGNGKVARLPKPIRDQINNLILDGVSYPDIIRRLGDAVKHLIPANLKEWKKYGYQDWLLEQDWLARVWSKAEFSADILAAPNSAGLHEAGLRIAAAQMFDQLMRFTAASQAGTSDQSEKFARLVNALSRLTREAIAFQKYRDALAKAIVELKQRDPDRDLAAKELLMLVNKMDQTFKVARPELAQLLQTQDSIRRGDQAEAANSQPHTPSSHSASPPANSTILKG
jgi:hypothetical protein